MNIERGFTPTQLSAYEVARRTLNLLGENFLFGHSLCFTGVP